VTTCKTVIIIIIICEMCISHVRGFTRLHITINKCFEMHGVLGAGLQSTQHSCTCNFSGRFVLQVAKVRLRRFLGRAVSLHFHTSGHFKGFFRVTAYMYVLSCSKSLSSKPVAVFWRNLVCMISVPRKFHVVCCRSTVIFFSCGATAQRGPGPPYVWSF
jgi:hypothetical protein